MRAAKRTLVGLGLAGSLLAVAAGAAFAAESSFKVLPAASGIVIDGNLSDWNLNAFGGNATFVIGPKVSTLRGGNITKDSENSGAVYLAYDAQYLYVAAQMTDDNVVGDSVDNGIWRNTAIELWLNTGNLGAPVSLADYGTYEDGDYQINLVPMSGGQKKAAYWVFPAGGSRDALNDGKTIEIKASYTATGYVLEARLPLAKLKGLTGLTAGTKLQAAVSTVHIDKAGTWGGLFTPGKPELFSYANLIVE